jgi:hypothetical protein
MSLKAFHIFFVTVSVLLTVVVGTLNLGAWRNGGEMSSLVQAIAWYGSALVLLAYGRYFLRKFKNISYL